eukprot:3849206-Rhodomonas_salina.1
MLSSHRIPPHAILSPYPSSPMLRPSAVVKEPTLRLAAYNAALFVTEIGYGTFLGWRWYVFGMRCRVLSSGLALAGDLRARDPERERACARPEHPCAGHPRPSFPRDVRY